MKTLAGLSAALLAWVVDHPEHADLPVVSACRNLDGSIHGIGVQERELGGVSRPCVVVW